MPFISQPLIVAITVVLSSVALTDTLYVDDDNCPGPGGGTATDPFCSIQTALDAAVDTDEILVAPGTYLETINLLGKSITLRSTDGADVTTIDAQGIQNPRHRQRKHLHPQQLPIRISTRLRENPDLVVALLRLLGSHVEA